MVLWFRIMTIWYWRMLWYQHMVHIFSSYQLQIFYSGLISSVTILLCSWEPHAHARGVLMHTYWGEGSCSYHVKIKSTPRFDQGGSCSLTIVAYLSCSTGRTHFARTNKIPASQHHRHKSHVVMYTINAGYLSFKGGLLPLQHKSLGVMVHFLFWWDQTIMGFKSF